LKRCLACDATFASVAWDCPECAWAPQGNGVPLFAPALAESDEHFPREDVRRLAELEEMHFWFVSRNELILWAVSRYFPLARTLLEVGCGTGIVLSRLQSGLPQLALTGADILPTALEIARERVPDAAFAQLDVRDLPFVEEFDVICALDVLEHIDEDALAVEQIAAALRPGGGLIVSVPQHPWLWSAPDEYGRHRRRYTRRGMRRLLEQGGFEPVAMTSSVMLLLPLVATSRLLRRRVTDDYDPFRELSLSMRTNRILGSVMGVERRVIQRGISLPAGSSLVVVARRR
jgi:SAM-dependent methyltransferase